jgi:PAS domain S-box-containing protein
VKRSTASRLGKAGIAIPVAAASLEAPVESALKRRVTGGFVVAVLLTIFIGFSSWRSTRLSANDADWVVHTYAVMERLKVTHQHVIEMETSARTFALVGQDPLLAHYESARDAVAQDTDQLRDLTADNPNQQRRLNVLEPQVRAALEFAAGMVARRQQMDATADANEVLETESLMSAVRATTQEMQAEETQLLSQRVKRTTAEQRLTGFFMVFSVLVGTALLTVARSAVNREIDVSARGRAQLSTLNAQLEERVEQRTAALQSEVAERTQVEEALREQAHVLDSAQVFVRDMNSRVVFWPRGAEKLYGFTPQEALGILSHDLFHTQFPEPLETIEKKLFETGMWEGELAHRRRDGVTLAVSSAWVLHRNSQGQPIRILETNVDITERKQAERRLAGQAEELSRQSEELLRSQQALESQTLMLQSVLDSMAEGLVAADEQGKFILWNPAATRIVGMGAENVPPGEWNAHYGVYLPDTITPLPSEQNPLSRAIHGEVSTAEIFVRNPELDEGAWIEISGGPLKGKDGATRGGVVAFRDITQRKIDEQKIHQLNEELEERVVQRTAQLAAANHELEAFTYSVSHDLRAPLRHIGGFSKILSEDFGPGMPEEAQSHLKRIESGAHRMGLLVDELLNLARVGRHALSLQTTQLNSVVEDVVSVLQPETEGRAVTWNIAELPAAECDPILIKQVFQNLLANALKFTRTRERAVIEISHRKENGETIIAIRDNGVGFNMKYKDKLFGTFQRLHRAEDFEGTGIGLATVKRIVSKHGGRVWAESEIDKGATFYFTLEAAEHVPVKPDQTLLIETKPSEVTSKTAAAGGQV